MDAAALLERSCAQGLFSGAVARVSIAGESRLDLAVGFRAPGEPMTRDTIFDLASLTKPLVTAWAILRLRDRMGLRLDSGLGDFLPEAPPTLAPLPVCALLSHTSGLPAHAPLYRVARTREGVFEQLLRMRLSSAPGQRWVYSCLGYLLLGFLIERVTGRPLARYAGEELFQPLGLRETSLGPPAERRDQCAATGACPWRGRLLRGETNDANAAAAGGATGNAGLFASADDLVSWAGELLDETGSLFSPVGRRDLVRNWAAAAGGRCGLGWWLRGNSKLPIGEGYSDRAFGHTGYTGVSIVLDPAPGAVALLLTNRTATAAPDQAFWDFRRDFHRAVAADFLR